MYKYLIDIDIDTVYVHSCVSLSVCHVSYSSAADSRVDTR